MNKKQAIVLITIVLSCFFYLLGAGPFIKNVVYFYIHNSEVESRSIELTKVQLANIDVLEQNIDNLSGNSLNKDPNIVYRFEKSILLKNISFELNASTNDYVQIFFQTEEDPSFKENNSVKIPVKQGMQKIVYRFSFFSLPKKVVALRIDTAEAGMSFQIKNLVVN